MRPLTGVGGGGGRPMIPSVMTTCDSFSDFYKCRPFDSRFNLNEKTLPLLAASSARLYGREALLVIII